MPTEELVKLVTELVRRPSCWDNAEDQRKLGEYVSSWFENCGMNVEVDELGNVVVNPGASVVMNGHLDVVPPAGEADYHPKIRGDKIVGRGTADMKGGVGVAMEIMKAFYKQYNELGAVFQVTEESEYEKSGADILCERGVFDDAKFIVEAEPSGELTTGKPFVLVGSEGGLDWSTEITTDESSYHAAYLHQANNAILAATHYIEGLINDTSLTIPTDEFKRSYNPKGLRTGKGPINVAKIEGGTQPTWTPNRCEVEFEKRLFPSERWMTFHEQLKEYSNRTGRAINANIGVKVLWHADPFMLDPTSDGYRFIANWAKGQNLELSISNGASDLNKIYNYLKTKGRNVIGVHFGPGFLDLAHRSDEFTLISGLEKFYGYYRGLLRELFDGEGKSLLQ